MKLIITSATILVATTAFASAKFSGLSTSIVSSINELGMVAPDPSTCGVIGALALIGIISARRIKVRS